MSVLAVDRMSLDEYLAFDRESEERWEYVEGHAVCMSGGTPEHSLLFEPYWILVEPRTLA